MILGKAIFDQEFFLEHFTWGDRCERILSHRRLQSVIVNNQRRRAGGQGQAAARFVERRDGDFLGGGRSKSAGIRNRAGRRCTIAMLSPFLPRITSLTRLAVPSKSNILASRD